MHIHNNSYDRIDRIGEPKISATRSERFPGGLACIRRLSIFEIRYKYGGINPLLDSLLHYQNPIEKEQVIFVDPLYTQSSNASLLGTQFIPALNTHLSIQNEVFHLRLGRRHCPFKSDRDRWYPH